MWPKILVFAKIATAGHRPDWLADRLVVFRSVEYRQTNCTVSISALYPANSARNRAAGRRRDNMNGFSIPQKRVSRKRGGGVLLSLPLW